MDIARAGTKGIVSLGVWVLSAVAAAGQTAPPPLVVRVVVVTMFEAGADTGDAPGEFQYWYEREQLTRRFPLPAAYHDVMANADGTILGIVTGEGTAHSASTVMAVGLDPRFDLSKAYWLVAGIAGAAPASASLGSAAWAQWVVDGDLAHEIDAREIPPDWEDPFVPLDTATPYPKVHPTTTANTVMYHLNPQLCDWAYQLTRDVPLPDTDKLKASRARYTDSAIAQKPPFVLQGDTLSSGTFWHGRLMERWAKHWVDYWTNGAGHYVTTAMEDTGTMQSLTMLARAGRVDLQRVMVLRTVSNFDAPPPGMTAAENLAAENAGQYSAYLPSLEAAYRVGSTVVHQIVDHWDKFAANPPTAQP